MTDHDRPTTLESAILNLPLDTNDLHSFFV